MSQYTIHLIENIEHLINIELQPQIRLREERACLMRMKANLAELKFLVADSMASDKELLK